MDTEILRRKSQWVREETLKLHRLAPGTRLASSLSPVEILVTLYYGGVLRYRPDQPLWEERDRLVISKGHGSVCMYPILADLGFFDPAALGKIGTETSFLGTIPDINTPGFETINGSLGIGLGTACGMAIALKRRASTSKVFVLAGDGEMNEGAVWEAIMFAAFHKLDNLTLVIDDNKKCMLGFAKDVMGLDPVEEKLAAFGWETARVDGHAPEELLPLLTRFKERCNGRPKVIVAETTKGKGVPELENDLLCHVRTLTPQEIEATLARWRS